jgi:hypothetical protein
MREKDQFDLINADKDYMDSFIGGHEDSTPEMDMFFSQQ